MSRSVRILLIGAVAAAPVGSSFAKVNVSPDHVMSALVHEAEAIGAVEVATITPLDSHEKPGRLQEFVVSGVVTECLKGVLRRGQPIRYGLFAEGRPNLAQHSIAFVRHAKGHSDIWTAIDGPMLSDRSDLRRKITVISKGCRA